MSSYFDIYKKRINRYGESAKERINGQRERQFDIFRKNSPNQVSFTYDGDEKLGVLQENKQDDKKISFVLQTETSLELPIGLTLSIENENWVVVRQLYKVGKGYNSFIMLKLSHIAEVGGNSISCSYLGPMTTFVRDLFYYSKTSSSLGRENNLHGVMVAPDFDISKDEYILIEGEGFVASEIDRISAPGVVYVSLVKTAVRDTTTIAIPDPEEDSYFWLKGGN